jgi:hypothetical protein
MASRRVPAPHPGHGDDVEIQCQQMTAPASPFDSEEEGVDHDVAGVFAAVFGETWYFPTMSS